MNCPARALFAILKSAREQKSFERAEWFADMVEIAAVTTQPAKYAMTLREHWVGIARSHLPADIVKAQQEKRITPWHIAAEMLKHAEQIKRGLGG